MSEEFDYDVLKKRIEDAKKNPFFSLSKEDAEEVIKTWYDSYKKLNDKNRRTIADNVNYIQLLDMIKSFPHVKTKVGFMVYVGDYVVSILGGDGAFCDEMTFEVAIIDAKTLDFATDRYDSASSGLHMSLRYQDLNDLSNVIDWCKSQ